MKRTYYTNQFKCAMCKEFLSSKSTVTSFAHEHNIPIKTFEKWLTLYRSNNSCFDTSIINAKFRPISPQNNIIDEKPNYSTMTEKELRETLLKRDIEIARLKKNYSVKITSEGKEFVTFSKKSTK